MLKRCIVCPNDEAADLLEACLPAHIVKSSKFYVNRNETLAAREARWVLSHCPAQLLLIRNAYTYREEIIVDLEGESEDTLSLCASESRFEVEVVAPALEWMLFETPEIFETIFREKATERLRLVGSYEPDRAIREAGTTVVNIVADLDDSARDLLRATPTAQKIMARIGRLDAKPYTYDDGKNATR